MANDTVSDLDNSGKGSLDFSAFAKTSFKHKLVLVSTISEIILFIIISGTLGMSILTRVIFIRACSSCLGGKSLKLEHVYVFVSLGLPVLFSIFSLAYARKIVFKGAFKNRVIKLISVLFVTIGFVLPIAVALQSWYSRFDSTPSHLSRNYFGIGDTAFSFTFSPMLIGTLLAGVLFVPYLLSLFRNTKSIKSTAKYYLYSFPLPVFNYSMFLLFVVFGIGQSFNYPEYGNFLVC